MIHAARTRARDRWKWKTNCYETFLTSSTSLRYLTTTPHLRYFRFRFVLVNISKLYGSWSRANLCRFPPACVCVCVCAHNTLYVTNYMSIFPSFRRRNPFWVAFEIPAPRRLRSIENLSTHHYYCWNCWQHCCHRRYGHLLRHRWTSSCYR